MASPLKRLPLWSVQPELLERQQDVQQYVDQSNGFGQLNAGQHGFLFKASEAIEYLQAEWFFQLCPPSTVEAF